MNPSIWIVLQKRTHTRRLSVEERGLLVARWTNEAQESPVSICIRGISVGMRGLTTFKFLARGRTNGNQELAAAAAAAPDMEEPSQLITTQIASHIFQKSGS